MDQTLHRPHVLVVEDSETQALQIRHLLETQGFRVSRFAAAEPALESLNDDLPDIVIADFHLPGMNGDELARQIRMTMRTRAIPVLMLTEARERSLERQGLESGADAYLPKSGDPDLLVLRIRALLRERGAAAAPAEAATAGTGFRRARVLLVDDDRRRSADLEKLLALDGYRVESATTAAAAIAAVEAAPDGWDCVIVALVAAGFDGIDLCGRLQRLRDAAGKPGAAFQLVALAAPPAVGKEALAAAFAAGADDMVNPDEESEALSLRIRTLVRRKLRRDEDRRIDDERRGRELAIAHARAEAEAARAKAQMAEALSQANAELADANTRLKDAQAKLIQAAKMASLGELVAGIAHEINNPLAFILAHQRTVERLLEEIAAGDGAALAKCRDRVGAMSLGLQRIQDLVLNLRRFSRLDEGEYQSVDVEESLGSVLALLAHKLDGIEVRRRFAGAPALYCSPALLNQVVMNIVGNAADAIAGSGAITIATRSDDAVYTIEISDTGPGVPDDLRERIFEPFFTTKPIGSGTGLGLAIAYSIVEAHGGTIVVGSGPEGGASFRIAIPVRAAA